jgi:hypothetical protein
MITWGTVKIDTCFHLHNVYLPCLSTSLLVLLPQRAQPQTTLIDTVILLCRSIRCSDPFFFFFLTQKFI